MQVKKRATVTAMLTRIHCAGCSGIKAQGVEVEVDISPGIGIHLIGMPDTAIRESIMRVTTAMKSVGFRIPGHKIVVNLAPGDFRKSGTGYDVAIALGIILASSQADSGCCNDFVIMGELGLDGSVRGIPGALPIVTFAKSSGFNGVILPKDSALECLDTQDIEIYYALTLDDVIRIISDPAFRRNRDIRKDSPSESGPARQYRIFPSDIPDFRDIRGQRNAKRALEIAVCGGHDTLMIGTPGSGKSSLARSLVRLMPEMSQEELIETGEIYSVCGLAMPPRNMRPFRSPHHSITVSSLIGGGKLAAPGEISLAHNGILFLDEIAEMPAKSIDALREPMENGRITISRLGHRYEYPSRFLLIAASNPCPCGYYGEGNMCKCSPGKIHSFLSRLSGPFMDRIDIKIRLSPVEGKTLSENIVEEDSEAVAERVRKVREIQRQRFSAEATCLNGHMGTDEIAMFCSLCASERQLCESLIEHYHLSARGYHKMLKVARTIADMDDCERIRRKHILEAVSYRCY